MFTLFGTKPQGSLIFDIGSSSIGASLVLIEEKKPTRILYTVRESYPFRTDITAELLMKDMLDTLKQVSERIHREGESIIFTHTHKRNPVRSTYVFFSSPWIVTQTNIISLHKEATFSITKSMLDDIISEHEALFKRDIMNPDKKLETTLSVLEKRIIHVSLNGYETDTPYGKKIRQADISLFMSLIPSFITERVIDTSPCLNEKTTQFFSFPLAAFSVVRDVFHTIQDYVIIDIGGEVTELCFVRKNVLVQTLSFPLGKNGAARALASSLHASGTEAQSIITLHQQDVIHNMRSETVKPVIDDYARLWKKALTEAIQKSGIPEALLDDVFVIAQGSLAQFFIKITSECTTGRITALNTEKYRSFLEYTQDVDRDPELALLTAFVARLSTHSV